MSAALEAALTYAARSLPVFPCRADKSPLVGPRKDAQGDVIPRSGGFRRATTDRKQIEEWWAEHPNALVGIPTGSVSGIDVLDIDVKHDGFKSVPEWETLSPVWARTPSGGVHVFFKSEGDLRSTSGVIGPGVDTRGEGGYVVVPPSRSERGVYRFEAGSFDQINELPTFPARLKELLELRERRRPGGEAKANLEEIAAAVAAIPNDQLGWDDWNRIGMAIWRASDGRAFDVFDHWSMKSGKYDPSETRQRWEHYSWSPPTEVGASTLFFEAQRANPTWRRKYEHASSRSAAEARISATPFVWVPPNEIPRRRWIYPPHYVRKFLSLTTAPPGLGKSNLSITEALALTSGKPLLDIRPEQPVRVWYWNGEDPHDELQRRFAAAAKHYGLSPADFVDRLFVDSGRDMPIVIAGEERGNVRVDDAVVNDLIATIKEHQIDAVIIDPFVTTHRVNENDNSAMELVAKTWSKIADATDSAVMLVHHNRKSNGNVQSVEDARGAVALLAAARTARVLSTMTDAERERAGLEERDRRFHFRADVGKANLTRPAADAEWYRLMSVDLENPGPGEEWDQGDEVGVVTRWSFPAETRREVTPDHIRRIQEIIANGEWREDQRATAWVGLAIAGVMGLDPDHGPDRRGINAVQRQLTRDGYIVVEVRRDPTGRHARKFVNRGRSP